MILVKLSCFGTHHASFLRDCEGGMSVLEAAHRHLAIDQPSQAEAARVRVASLARDLVRRRGDPRWRLIGIPIGQHYVRNCPTEEGFRVLPDASFADSAPSRQQARNDRLRHQRLQLLTQVAREVADTPRAGDPVETWLSDPLAERLRRCGVTTLGEFGARIAVGGRWWRGLPAIGPKKAQILSRVISRLVGPLPPSTVWPAAEALQQMAILSGRCGSNRVTPSVSVPVTTDDSQAIRAWAAAQRSSLTAQQYEREADRFRVWCVVERRKALSDAEPDDCREYVKFLSNIPPGWSSRRKARRFETGWAPFRGPLSSSSQRLALESIRALFEWLVERQYLVTNPWLTVERNSVDRKARRDPLSSEAWTALEEGLDQLPAGLATSRLRWLILFARSSVLRPREAVVLRRGQLEQSATGWTARVVFRRQVRVVLIPEAAVATTRAYFAMRGSSFDTSPDDTPLLASLGSNSESVTYQSMRDAMLRFARGVLRNTSLPETQRGVEFTANDWFCQPLPAGGRLRRTT